MMIGTFQQRAREVKPFVGVPINQPVGHGLLNWRGHRVHVTETGQGDPLLLVTGLGSNTDMWAPFAEQFPSRRIIRFDAPGAGLSSTPTHPVGVGALADLVAAVLVGFSYGGFVAQQLAYDHPARIRRLVLAATNCGIGSALGSIAALAELATPLRYYSPSHFDRTAAAVYGGVTGRDPSARRAMMVARHRRPPSAYGYAMQMLAVVGWSSWPFLHRIPHETLVICGDDDPLVPVVNAEMLARRIPRATLEIVKRGGHLLLWDDPQHLGERIGRFVNAAHTTKVTSRRRA
jgi:pimeloyl-ACP methyl ester carboxylesterase